MGGLTPAQRNEAYYSSLNYPQVLYFILSKKGVVNNSISPWFEKLWKAYRKSVDDTFFKQMAFEEKAEDVPNIKGIADKMDDFDLFRSNYQAALRSKAEEIIRDEIEVEFKRIVKKRGLKSEDLKYGKQDIHYVDAADAVWRKYYRKVQDYPNEVNYYPELKIARYLCDKMRSPGDYFKVPEYMVSAETWTSVFVKVNVVLLTPIAGSVAGAGWAASLLVPALSAAVDTSMSEAISYQYGDKKVKDEFEMKKALLKVGKSALLGALSGSLSKALGDAPGEVIDKVISTELVFYETLLNKVYDCVITGQRPTTTIQEVLGMMVSALFAAAK